MDYEANWWEVFYRYQIKFNLISDVNCLIHIKISSLVQTYFKFKSVNLNRLQEILTQIEKWNGIWSYANKKNYIYV